MLSSLLTGGLTGVIGSVVSNITDYFEERAKRKHEVEMRKLDLQELDKEYEYQRTMAEKEHDFALEEKSYELQERSYEHDQVKYSKGLKIESWWIKMFLVLVDVVRGLVRPALTLFLIWLVWETRQEADQIISSAGMEGITPEQAISVYTMIVDMILYLSAVAVTWWFGTRPRNKKRM